MRVKPSGLLDILRPRVDLGYNAAGDLIRIKKHLLGITYERIITDPDIVDNVIDRWVEYGDWSVV